MTFMGVHTFRYMTCVAAENQDLKTAFLDLENVDSDIVLASIRTNTKVSLYSHLSEVRF
jgi:hypothetical protein